MKGTSMKIKFRNFLIVITILLTAENYCHAITQVGGPIHTDTTWGLANSPYLISSTIKIQKAVTLTIEPGVHLFFKEPIEFVIEGELLAKGKATLPIYISSDGSALGRGVIKFTENAIGASYNNEGDYIGGSIFEHVVIDNIGGIIFESNAAYLNNLEYNNSLHVRYAGVKSDCFITNSKFVNNISPSSHSFNYPNGNSGGGAIYLDSSSLIIKNCTFEDNSAIEGGAIYSTDVTSFINLINCTFKNNFAFSDGGAVNLSSDSIDSKLDKCVFKNNFSYFGNGGAIYSYSNSSSSFSNIEINASEFSNNSAYGSGGAISSYATILLLDGSHFYYNMANSGGSISFGRGYPLYDYLSPNEVLERSASFKFSNCNFTDNVANRGGGAISIGTDGGQDSKLFSSITDCSFYNNSVVDEEWGRGGAIVYGSYQASFSLELDNCILSNNFAAVGSVIHAIASIHASITDFTLHLDNCTLMENNSLIYYSTLVSFSDPKIIWPHSFSNTSCKITNCIIANNSNGLYFRNGTMENTLILNNTVSTVISGSGIIKDSTIINNNYSCPYQEHKGAVVRGDFNISGTNFIDNSGFTYLFSRYDTGVYSGILDATNNFWGTADENYIQSNIWDYYDDSQLGETLYYPYLTELNTNAPPISTNILSVTPLQAFLSENNGFTEIYISNSGTGQMNWTAEVVSGSSWLSIATNDSGTNDETIVCQAKANNGYLSRTGTIRVSANEAKNSPILISINQEMSKSLKTVILSKSSSNYKVTSGNNVQIYGSSSSNNIVIEAEAQAEIINAPGHNTVQIQSHSNDFTVSRYGTVVFLSGSDGTTLKIPATRSVQTISFTDRSLKLQIYKNKVIFDDQLIDNTASLIAENSEKLRTCGAYVAQGVWKEFDCYNLAAIGKITKDDPFTPSWRLIGGYWKWGSKGPDPKHWYHTNTLDFIHGPTGPDGSNTCAGFVPLSGYDSSFPVPDGAWLEDNKTSNDPCPSGFRVPTISQWQGVLDNNNQTVVGTWSGSDTNYSSALFFGSDLMLPAAGSCCNSNRGRSGYYWSSSENLDDYAFALNFNSGYVSRSGESRRSKFSIRCVTE
jgi:predicted outer membrane repeat protein